MAKWTDLLLTSKKIDLQRDNEKIKYMFKQDHTLRDQTKKKEAGGTRGTMQQ
jgi:hypothetical protein